MNRIEVDNQGYTLLAKFEVKGQPPRKSNQRRIVTRGRGKSGPPMLIKSEEALQYIKDFNLQVPSKYRDLEYGSLDDDLRLDIIVWYTSRRPDLSIELIKDCLEKAGVIKDDRYIREEHIYGFVDKHDPRIAIKLYQIPPGRELPF